MGAVGGGLWSVVRGWVHGSVVRGSLLVVDGVAASFRISLVFTYGIAYAMGMETITATQARADLYRLIDRAGEEPVRIAGKRGNAVLVSEGDWEAIQETLYLLSIPGMRASIRKGLKTPVGRCNRPP